MRRRIGLASALVAALTIGVAGVAPAVAAETTGTVSGVITYAHAPVPGAVVEVNEWDNGDDVWTTVAHGTTNASGAYSIKVDPGSYEVSAGTAAPSPYLVTNYGNTVRDADAKVITVKAAAELHADITLVAAARLTGKVVDSAGKPVKNVNVGAASTSRFGEEWVTTNAAGVYTISNLATGTVSVHVQRSGSVASPRTASVRQGSLTTLKPIVLKKGATATITGHIAATRPQNQELVLLDAKHRQVAVLSSDKKGNVRFTGLAQGAYRVVLSGTNLSKRVVVRSGRTASFGTIKRPNRKVISGVVTSPSGKAVKNTYVQVVDSYGTYAGASGTDSKGRFAILGVLSGSYHVVASNLGKGYANATVSAKVTRGKNKSGVKVKLHTGSTLTGIVRDASGSPVPGVDVEIAGTAPRSSAVTDSHGRWTLRGVGAGKRTVELSDWYVGGYHSTTAKATAVAGKTVTVKTITVR